MKRFFNIMTLLGLTLILPSQSVLKEDAMVGTMRVRKVKSVSHSKEVREKTRIETEKQLKDKIKNLQF